MKLSACLLLVLAAVVVSTDAATTKTNALKEILERILLASESEKVDEKRQTESFSVLEDSSPKTDEVIKVCPGEELKINWRLTSAAQRKAPVLSYAKLSNCFSRPQLFASQDAEMKQRFYNSYRYRTSIDSSMSSFGSLAIRSFQGSEIGKYGMEVKFPHYNIKTFYAHVRVELRDDCYKDLDGKTKAKLDMIRKDCFVKNYIANEVLPAYGNTLSDLENDLHYQIWATDAKEKQIQALEKKVKQLEGEDNGTPEKK